MRALIGVSALLLATASPATAQHHDGAASLASQPTVGTVNLANSGNAAAQPHFQRGLALLHNFEYPAAAEAFRSAQQADPHFALAYWGEAMTYNHPLWAEQDADKARAVLARLGPTREARAAKAPSAREKQWLDTVEALYGEGSKADRDRAYAESMRLLFEADPTDVNARAFRALSLMGLAHQGRDVPLYMQSAALLEEVFPANQEHPGVLHYLIHAYDDPAHAPLGERAAARYAKVAPDAGHAQHMVSHIYLALGRWPEVETANAQAMRVVNAQRAAAGKPPGHCGHYIQWQAYSLMQQGRDASPLIAACRTEAMQEMQATTAPTSGGAGSLSSWSDLAVRHGIETGAWPDQIQLPEGRFEVPRFNLAYARLLASRTKPAEAAMALTELRRSRGQVAAAMAKDRPDDHESMQWFDRAIAQGEAIVLLAQGKQVEGITALKAAAAAEAALPVPFGPPVLQKPSVEMLGEELLAAGRKAEAAEAFRAVLAAAPNRRLARSGLEAASR